MAEPCEPPPEPTLSLSTPLAASPNPSVLTAPPVVQEADSTSLTGSPNPRRAPSLVEEALDLDLEYCSSQEEDTPHLTMARLPRPGWRGSWKQLSKVLTRICSVEDIGFGRLLSGRQHIESLTRMHYCGGELSTQPTIKEDQAMGDSNGRKLAAGR